MRRVSPPPPFLLRLLLLSLLSCLAAVPVCVPCYASPLHSPPSGSLRVLNSSFPNTELACNYPQLLAASRGPTEQGRAPRPFFVSCANMPNPAAVIRITHVGKLSGQEQQQQQQQAEAQAHAPYNVTVFVSSSYCGGVGGMAVSSDGRTLFVACSSTPMLGSVIAVSTNASLLSADQGGVGVPSSSIQVLLARSACGNAVSLALSDDDSALVVACSQAGVVEMDIEASGDSGDVHAHSQGGTGVPAAIGPAVIVRATRTLVAVEQCGFSRAISSTNRLLDRHANGDTLVGCTQGTLLLRDRGETALWLHRTSENAYVCAPVAVQLSRLTHSAWIACSFMGGSRRAGAVLSIDFTSSVAVSITSVLPVSACSQISSLALSPSGVLLVSCINDPLIAVRGTAFSPIGTDPRGYTGVTVDGDGRVLAATQCNSQATPGSVVAMLVWTNTPLGVDGQRQLGLAAGVEGMVLISDHEAGPRAALGPLSFPIAPGPQLCPSVARDGIVSNAHGLYAVLCSNGTVGQVYLLQAHTATDVSTRREPLPIAALCPNPISVWINDESPPLMLVGCGPSHNPAAGSSTPSLLSVRAGVVSVLASSLEVPKPSGFAVSRDGSQQLWMVTDKGVMSMPVAGGPAIVFSAYYCSRLVVTSGRDGLLYGLCNVGLVRWNASGEMTVLLSGVNQCGGSIGSLSLDPRSDVVYATCNAQWLYRIAQEEMSALQMPNECIRTFDVAVGEQEGDVLLNCNQHSVYVLSLAQRCPVGYESSATGCTACFLASHRNYSHVLSSSFQCRACDPGSVGASLGSIDCEVCGPGKYAASQLTDCAPCPVGRYSSGTHNLACEPCEPGYFGNSTEIKVPTCSGACEAGHWCAAGSTSAQQMRCGAVSVYCPAGSGAPMQVMPGTYSVNPTVPEDGAHTRSDALPCEPGRWCDGSGLQRNCSEGFFALGPNNKECSPCEAGTFSGTGSETCTPCPPGSDSAPASSVCTPCLQGWHKPPGAQHCHQCAPGRFSSSAGSHACDSCGVGSFGASAGLVECTLCGHGTSSNVTERTTPCDACAPGTYASSFGQAHCAACEADMYIGVSGSPACDLCDVPFIVSADHTSCDKSGCMQNHVYSSALRKCIPCPLGQHSEPGGRCVPCELGWYTPVAGVGCISCQQAGMEGISCAAGLASVKQGFWAFKRRAPDAQFDIYQTVLCPSGFCPGAKLQGAEAATSANGSMPLPTNATTFEPQYCQFPRLSSPENHLCGECAPGFMAWGQECVACAGVNWAWLLLLLCCSFGVVLLLLPTGGVNTTGRGLLTVLVYFSQTAAVIAGSQRGWISWLGLSHLAPGSFGRCLAPLDPYQQFILAVNVPTILLMEMMVVAGVHRAIAACHRSAARVPLAFTPASLSVTGLGHSFRWSRYAGGCMAVLMFSYTQVSTTAVGWLRCQQVGSRSVLFVQPAVDCHSSLYKSYRVIAIAVLIGFGVGLPVLAMLLIRMYQGKREPKRHAATKQAASLSPPPERSWTSPLLLHANDAGSPGVQDARGAEFELAAVHATAHAPAASDANDVDDRSPSDLARSLDHDETIYVAAAPFASSSPSSPSSILRVLVDPLLLVFNRGGWWWQPQLLLRRAAFVLVSVLLSQRASLRLMLLQLLCILSVLLQLHVRPFLCGISNLMALVADVLLLLMCVLLGGWPREAIETDTPLGLMVAICVLVAPVSLGLLVAVVRSKWRTWRQQGTRNEQRHSGEGQSVDR